MTIQSVKRATDIISLFSSSQPSLGITQIATALELNKATAWGLVTTLEQQGFLQQDPDTHKYSVGSKLFELGMVYVGGLEINTKASRFAHELASRTTHNVRVGVWENGTALITLLAMPKAEDSISHQIGPRVPCYCSGIGKALLAFIPQEELELYLSGVELVPHTRNTITSMETLLEDIDQARLRGYSISNEEMIPGMIALGAPIYGRAKRLVGAISIAAPAATMAGAYLTDIAKKLLATAGTISQEMGCYQT